MSHTTTKLRDLDMANPSSERVFNRTEELKKQGKLPTFGQAKVKVNTKLPPQPRCEHRGAEPTGETVTCGSCRGNVSLKVFDCAIFGTCTLSKPTTGKGCCNGCTSYSPEKPSAEG